MVDIIDPKKGEIIVDPACGTGGFLINSINHIRENTKNYQPAEIQEQIRGIEKKPLPHLLCTTNLMLNGFDVPAVKRDNYLSNRIAIGELRIRWISSLRIHHLEV